MKSEGVGLIVRAISFQDVQPMCSWSGNVTDRQTDDMQSQYRDLHYSASRGKNEATKIRRVELVYSIGLLVCGVNYKLKLNYSFSWSYQFCKKTDIDPSLILSRNAPEI